MLNNFVEQHPVPSIAIFVLSLGWCIYVNWWLSPKQQEKMARDFFTRQIELQELGKELAKKIKK